MMSRRLAVWGDPIAHSKSPLLHSAAYRALGLDWAYGRQRVDAHGFIEAFEELDGTWRGLSVTMPLKEQAYAVASVRDRHAELTGAVNTLLLGDTVAGFNTDVGGIVDAFAENGIRSCPSGRVLGAGATASSALVALAELGAEQIDVRARRPERAAGLVALGTSLGTTVVVRDFAADAAPVSATVATLPSGTVLDDGVAAKFAETGGALLDAAYAPWPSALAARWAAPTVISGLEMLLHQAVRQVRIFVAGDPSAELVDEAAVVAAMRAALI
ncbi:shikimate dehydrogenase family protein [Microbacterium sp. A82]|uniref:shikimate dehydrogenase family protein n=1 Tax=Microbacterium sp. A82 TaxID=3450452 RepID=UPI003F62A83C